MLTYTNLPKQEGSTSRHLESTTWFQPMFVGCRSLGRVGCSETRISCVLGRRLRWLEDIGSTGDASSKVAVCSNDVFPTLKKSVKTSCICWAAGGERVISHAAVLLFSLKLMSSERKSRNTASLWLGFCLAMALQRNCNYCSLEELES